MKRQEKIDLLVERLGGYGFNGNSVKHLKIAEIDRLLEFLVMESYLINNRKRPQRPLHDKVPQDQYRGDMVEYIEGWGLELPLYLSAKTYEAIANFCESKQTN